MINKILNYQKASEKLLHDLENNKKVLAVFVFGSIVNGDIWEGSDIDVFVVYKDSFNEVRDIYTEVLNIPVHMKVLNKKSFLDLYEANGKKGLIRNLLLSSKLVFSRDDDIEVVFNKAKYSLDEYNGIWNLVYLGNIIKSIGVTKKYLHNDRVFTSYEVLIRALDSFAKLYLNLNSYSVSKDSVKMAMNLNNDFNNVVKELFNNGCKSESIQKTIEYIEKYLDYNISMSAKSLLDYLYEKNEFLSSYEINNDDLFNEFNIKTESILKELYKRNIVRREVRKLELPNKEKLISENVYCYR